MRQLTHRGGYQIFIIRMAQFMNKEGTLRYSNPDISECLRDLGVRT